MNRDDNVDRMHGKEYGEPDHNYVPGKLPVKWADRAQYHSAEMPNANRAPGGGSRPTVTLLNATPDPLGSLAALCGIYEGKVVRRLSEVTDDDRRAAWEAMRATVLNGPLEAIQFHFLVEGVTRAFTHQAVRNRFSFFAQESMRFAVVDDEPWIDRQAYPPSLAAQPAEVGSDAWSRETPEETAYRQRREAWDVAIEQSEAIYKHLVEVGVPAEEARGLMPHSMTTRYHWIVNVRALLAEAGKRLCTQAQFEWRVVMAEVVKALRGYRSGDQGAVKNVVNVWHGDRWQFELMANALQPVCYQTGGCGFMAKFDRGCTIRERVNRFEANNVPSSQWQLDGQWDVNAGPQKTVTVFGNDERMETMNLYPHLIPIQPKEWLADPGAART